MRHTVASRFPSNTTIQNFLPRSIQAGVALAPGVSPLVLERHEGFVGAFTVEEAMQQHGQDGGTRDPPKPSEHQPAHEYLGHEKGRIAHG